MKKLLFIPEAEDVPEIIPSDMKKIFFSLCSWIGSSSSGTVIFSSESVKIFYGRKGIKIGF